MPDVNLLTQLYDSISKENECFSMNSIYSKLIAIVALGLSIYLFIDNPSILTSWGVDSLSECMLFKGVTHLKPIKHKIT